MTDQPQIENEMLLLGVYALVVRGQNQDLLMGKNVNDFVSIPGLETLLHKFVADLDKTFRYIYKDDIPSFLNELERQFHLDFMSLLDNIVANIEGIKSFENDDVMIWYLVITKTLESMREQTYTRRGWTIISKKFEEFNHSPLTPALKDKIQSMDDAGNADLSLLYNLVFVEFLAELYKDIKVQNTIAKIIDLRLNHIFQELK